MHPASFSRRDPTSIAAIFWIQSEGGYSAARSRMQKPMSSRRTEALITALSEAYGEVCYRTMLRVRDLGGKLDGRHG
jgi:hypothetical protein